MLSRLRLVLLAELVNKCNRFRALSVGVIGARAVTRGRRQPRIVADSLIGIRERELGDAIECRDVMDQVRDPLGECHGIVVVQRHASVSHIKGQPATTIEPDGELRIAYGGACREDRGAPGLFAATGGGGGGRAAHFRFVVIVHVVLRLRTSRVAAFLALAAVVVIGRPIVVAAFVRVRVVVLGVGLVVLVILGALRLLKFEDPANGVR